jgi:hypothetical protein
MDVRASFMQACRLACMATNRVLVHSSPNMPALCAVRAVLRETKALRERRPDVEDLQGLLGRGEGRALEAAITLLLQQTVHDSVTGEGRMVDAGDVNMLLTTDPVDALNEFYEAFDVLSLQDAVGDFRAEDVGTAVRSVLDLVDAASGGTGGGDILDYLPILLSDTTDHSRHPLREEGFGVYREGLSPTAAQVYGLLTLSVLYDLANDEFRQGTSLFSDRFSGEFQELIESFTLDDTGELVGIAVRVYGMLVSGEVTL